MTTPGEILRNKRRSLGKTIFEVSQETKILEKYLKQIESNQFELFDSPVFARGFIKIYSQYLGLDEEKILALFRRDNKELIDIKVKTKKRKTGELNQGNFTKTLVYIAFAAIVVIFSIFVYIQLYQYQLTPVLQIITPAGGYTTNTNQISIEGITSKSSVLSLNQKAIANNNGTFKENIILNPGENVITAIAINKKNNTKRTEQVIKIYFEQPKVQTPVNTQPEPNFSIQLQVLKEASWVKLIVDDKQKLAQILNPGFKQTYKFTSNIEVVTGKIDNTKVLINNQVRIIKADPKTGIASLACKVENREVICSK